MALGIQIWVTKELGQKHFDGTDNVRQDTAMGQTDVRGTLRGQQHLRIASVG